MFSIATAEIRWFYHGQIPIQLLDWLSKKKGVFEDQNPRTDVYILLPGNDDLGIKVREGRMEIKKKLGDHEVLIDEFIAGKMETWIKWSSKLEDEISQLGSLTSNPAHWVQIYKKRYLQKFEIEKAHQLIPFPSHGYPEKGATIELSNLIVDQENWWTLGLECYGQAEHVASNLKNLAPELLKDLPKDQLRSGISYGYPEWINEFKKKP